MNSKVLDGKMQNLFLAFAAEKECRGRYARGQVSLALLQFPLWYSYYLPFSACPYFPFPIDILHYSRTLKTGITQLRSRNDNYNPTGCDKQDGDYAVFLKSANWLFGDCLIDWIRIRVPKGVKWVLAVMPANVRG